MTNLYLFQTYILVPTFTGLVKIENMLKPELWRAGYWNSKFACVTFIFLLMQHTSGTLISFPTPILILPF